jgi:hypothetical protein
LVAVEDAVCQMVVPAGVRVEYNGGAESASRAGDPETLGPLAASIVAAADRVPHACGDGDPGRAGGHRVGTAFLPLFILAGFTNINCGTMTGTHADRGMGECGAGDRGRHEDHPVGPGIGHGHRPGHGMSPTTGTMGVSVAS